MVWASSIKKEQIFERLHKKVTKYLLYETSTQRVTYRLTGTLTKHRKVHLAVQVYKSLNRLSPPYLQDVFSYARAITGRVGRHINHLFIPSVRTNYGKNAFYYKGATYEIVLL